MKIVFLDRDTLSPETRLPAFSFQHELQVYARTADDEVEVRIRDADVVITNKVKLTRQALQGARNLRMVAVAATGTDNVDLQACR